MQRETEGGGRDVIFGLGRLLYCGNYLVLYPHDVVSFWISCSFLTWCHGMNGAQQLNLAMEEEEDQVEEVVETAEIDDDADDPTKTPKTARTTEPDSE